MASKTPLRARFVAIALGLASLVAAPSARAADFFASFQVQLNEGVGPIDNIILFDRYADGSGMSWPYSIPEGGGEFTNPFPYSESPVGFLVYGLILNEIDGNRVVLFMNDATADYAEGKEWTTLFPEGDDEFLISMAIETVAAGEDGPAKEAASQLLTNFAEVDATTIPGPNDTTLSAYFQLGGTFKVVAFSTGEIIGTGTSLATPVPEPSTWALGALGTGALALARRRRRSHLRD